MANLTHHFVQRSVIIQGEIHHRRYKDTKRLEFTAATGDVALLERGTAVNFLPFGGTLVSFYGCRNIDALLNKCGYHDIRLQDTVLIFKNTIGF